MLLIHVIQVDCGKLDGLQFSKEHDFVGYFETSAKTGQGIQEAVKCLVKKVCYRYSHAYHSYHISKTKH